MSKPGNDTVPTPDGDRGDRPESDVPNVARSHRSRLLAYAVVALLYLSFGLYIANSQAVTAFIAEVTRLFEKFVF